MKMTWTNSLSSSLSLACIFIFNECRQRYEPPVLHSNLNYLVVDGFLNNSPDSTFIRLTHTTPLIDDYYVDRVGELNAHITVEDETGNIVYTFVPANNNGTYTVPGMNLDINKKYRLHIKTIDGNEYLSDDIVVKPNPPIDSISWKHNDGKVAISVNTHDPDNNTHYYRWDYRETWEYYTRVTSEVKYTGEPYFLKKREPGEMINHCWKTNLSKELLLSSTTQLAQDVVSQKNVRFLSANSFELVYKYSILVNQYALSPEAFDYYQALKKNTEQTGSIFDPQPFTLPGNIHCSTNPAIPVAGYMTATNLQSKRIFISNAEVAPWNEYIFCPQPWVVGIDSFNYYFNENGNPGSLKLTPIDAIYINGILTGAKAAYKLCADCIYRGGVTKKPDFWQ